MDYLFLFVHSSSCWRIIFPDDNNGCGAYLIGEQLLRVGVLVIIRIGGERRVHELIVRGRERREVLARPPPNLDWPGCCCCCCCGWCPRLGVDCFWGIGGVCGGVFTSLAWMNCFSSVPGPLSSSWLTVAASLRWLLDGSAAARPPRCGCCWRNTAAARWMSMWWLGPTETSLWSFRPTRMCWLCWSGFTGRLF